MNTEWKQRREAKSEIVGTKALQKVIDEYEAKMCQLHTENLNLKHDIERYKEDLKNQIEKYNQSDKSNSYLRKQLKESETALKVYQATALKVYQTIDNGVKNALSKVWWKRGASLRLLEMDIKKLIRGY